MAPSDCYSVTSILTPSALAPLPLAFSSQRSFDRNLNLGSSMTSDLTDTLGKLSFTQNSNNASYFASSSDEWKAFKAKVEGHAVQCQLGVEGGPSIISTSQDLERSLTRSMQRVCTLTSGKSSQKYQKQPQRCSLCLTRFLL